MSWGSSSKKKKSNGWSSGWGSWDNSSSSNKSSSSGSWGGGWGNSSSSKDPKFNFGKESKEKREGNPLREMRALTNQYSPASADCRFEEILYSKVPSEYLHRFEKHPLTRPAVWEAGLRNNPDPKRLVPVAIRGYGQLKQRAELALAGNFSCQAALTEISKELDKIRDHTDREIRNELMDARQTQIELTRRLLAVVTVFLERSTHGSLAAITGPGAGSSGAADSGMDGTSDTVGFSMGSMDPSSNPRRPAGASGGRVFSMYGSPSKGAGLMNGQGDDVHSGGGHHLSARLTGDELKLKQRMSAVMTGAKEVTLSMANMEDSLNSLQAESENYHRRMQRSIEQFGLWNAVGQSGLYENSDPNQRSLLSEDGSLKISQFLENQQRMIANMSRSIEDDLNDLTLIQKGLRLDHQSYF